MVAHPEFKTQSDITAVEPNPFSHLEFISKCMAGIAVGGMLYPVVLAVYGIFRIFIPHWISGGPFNIGEGLTLAFVMLVFGSLAGFMVAAISAWIVGALICAINASLGYPLRPQLFISCVGGLAGYLPLALLFIAPQAMQPGPPFIEAFLLGPCLAALIGQTGARWWARKRVMYPHLLYKSNRTVQFRISHVLILTAWFAATFAILRLTAQTNLPLLVAVYFPVQIVCIGIGRLLDQYAEWKTGIRYVS